MNDGLTKENLLLIIPPALKQDPSIMALAAVDAEALAARLAEIDRVRLISNIDGLDETVLDILARDFKVDWWDPEYSIDEKRRTLKGSWRVHKTLGTKAAVETAIRAIYPLTTVEEWFEYGGEPYHFRLNIDITSDSGDRNRQKRVLQRLEYYKSLRSHNDGVRYFLYPEKSWAVAGGGYTGSRQIDHAAVKIPELKPPGGRVVLGAAGGLAGSHSRERAAVTVPPLKKPGAGFVLAVGGGFTGSRRQEQAAITIPALKPAGAGRNAAAVGGFTGSWRRIDARADAPELVKPKGAAERPAAAGYIGAVERARVRLRPANIRVPTGRAATGGRAGVFHIYQSIRVSVGNPATTISGR